MARKGISRREWLLASYASVHWAEIARAQQHAHEAAQSGGAPFAVLDREMAAEIEAIAAQIIPSDGTPGAREAGVIYFIDRALATFEKDKLEAYRGGLKQVQAKRAELFPGSKSIAALAPEQQLALVRAVEKTDFFELVRFHSILGFFGDPSRGGNRDYAGWKLIGIEDRHSFEPPFGYYDGEEMKK
jgi:gluconate 2-dehydrogenase gamma chain